MENSEFLLSGKQNDNKSSQIIDKMKSQICLHIANTEKRLIDGADEYLQLLSIFMCIKSVVINIESIYLAK